MNESKEQDSYIDPLNVPSWVSEDVHSIPLPTVLIPKAGSHIKGDFDDILTNESKPLFIKKQNQRKSIGSVTIDVQSGDHVSRNICCCFPKCDIVLVAFQLFHFIAGVIAIGSLVDNFYVLSKLEKHTQESTREIILRIYCLFFSISLVIIETEYEYLNNFFALFRQWFFRGLWYIFIGTLTFHVKAMVFYVENIVGISLIGIGVFYIIMALLQMKQYKIQRAQRWYQENGYEYLQ